MAQYIGKGTKLFIENSTTADQWDVICFVELTEPEGVWDVIEVTDSSTTGKSREKMTTLLDEGSCSFTGIMDDASAELAIVQDLDTAYRASDLRNFRIDNTQSTVGTRKEFSGYLTKFNAAKFDGLGESLKVAGEIVLTGPLVVSNIA
jgi:hypothetical protein